jgi:hypothetical protein
MSKTKSDSLESKTEKYVMVEDLKLSTGKEINLSELAKAFESIAADAERANKGNKAAGRRFRLNTTALSKGFLEIRKITPRAKMTSKAK